MATQSFFYRARANSGVERVWRELQNPSTWRRIGGVNRITHEDFDDQEDLVGYRFAIVVAGMDHQGTARRLLVERFRRVTMGIDSSQLAGEISVELEPVEGATWVELTMSMSSKGFMSAMLFPAIASAVSDGFDEAARAFVESLGV